MTGRLIEAKKLRAEFESHSVWDEFTVGYIMGLVDEQPTVDAIPVEWINKYTNEHRAYMHAFSDMIACWYDEKENREYEMACDMRDYCEKYEPSYNPEDGSL